MQMPVDESSVVLHVELLVKVIWANLNVTLPPGAGDVCRQSEYSNRPKLKVVFCFHFELESRGAASQTLHLTLVSSKLYRHDCFIKLISYFLIYSDPRVTYPV